MQAFLVAFLAALAAALVLTPLARAAASRLGVVDHPDGRRKLQERPTPLLGGVAVFVALTAALALAGPLFRSDPASLWQLASALVPAAGFVCLVGAIDDRWNLNARFKLALQVGSVIPIVAAGYYIDRVVAFGVPIEFGWLGAPLTVLWLVGCINALNLLDGMDGLASVVGLSAAAMTAIIAVNVGQPHVALVAAALAGALAGFLAYNLPPASIYLGDSGSMVIGLVVGMISMQGAMKTTATLSITVPAVLMSVPMLDTALAIIRRKLTGQRFDAADRGHIHHRLLDRGLSKWQALCVIAALCLTTGAAATAATIFRYEAIAWLTALSLFILLLRTGAVGRHELELVKRSAAALVASLAVRFSLAASPAQRTVLLDGGATVNFDQAWNDLREQLEFCRPERLELSLSEGSTVVGRRDWRRSPPTLVARPGKVGWSLSVSIAYANNVSCELRASGVREAASPQALVQLAGLLHSYARHWANCGHDAPRAEIRLVAGAADELPAAYPARREAA